MNEITISLTERFIAFKALDFGMEISKIGACL
jgi:hypothetical protein